MATQLIHKVMWKLNGATAAMRLVQAKQASAAFKASAHEIDV
jgi:hypothetical protein